jgi:uncharacterized membrane protein YjjP (DUF1212 family)
MADFDVLLAHILEYTKSNCQYCGKESAYVLLLTKLGEHTSNIGIMKGASVGILAQLISKKTGEIVWENAAIGNFTAGFLAAMFANEKKEALYPGITAAFSTFTPYEGIIMSNK